MKERTHEKSGSEKEQEREDEFQGFKLKKKFLPNFVIVLEADDLAIKQRVKDMPIEKTLNTHYNEKDTDRRLKTYKDL